MDIGCDLIWLKCVEVYYRLGMFFGLFIFRILETKNRPFHEIAKHL